MGRIYAVSDPNVYHRGVDGLNHSLSPSIVSAVKPDILVRSERAKGAFVSVIGVEGTVEKFCGTKMNGFGTEKLLKRNTLFERAVQALAEDTWRRAKAVKVCNFTTGLLNEVPGHFNFTECQSDVECVFVR